MLQLKNIKKDYIVGSGVVHALKGVDIKFRKNEFVSILGPSGCGKTTLLNIIGGLDGYTEGDLIINGKSTKDYKDRDWDSYRNHSVGFVFQSYNLIPHQTVLANVELALSLSGVSKKERRARSIQALHDVGLGDQIFKKPNQLSGGQCQRVAIARALVNNPDIILADEPTGALDTETSVSVMEILKEIAKDRLIVMVTHNPDIANTYSTRIINMLDGVITNDSMPLTKEEIRQYEQEDEEKLNSKVKTKLPSMSFATSFLLSLKNLFTKKGRTILTAFAGSIGIIGIALIFAVSQGTTNYINQIQEETLSSYPLTLEKEHMSIGTLLNAFMGDATSNEEHANDAVYQKGMLYDLVNALTKLETTENDLQAFKTYIENLEKTDQNVDDAITGIKYTYNYDLLVYTKSVDGTIIKSDTEELFNDLLMEYFQFDMSSMNSMSSSFGMPTMSTGTQLWEEMLSGEDGQVINDVLLKQYDLIYGTWPNSYDEIVLVVDENNEIDDMTLYALGLMSKEEIDALADAAFNKAPIENKNNRWTYEEICDLEYRVILNSDRYINIDGKYIDIIDYDESLLNEIYDTKGINLKVSGIIRPNADASSNMLSGSIAYTNKLTKYISEKANESQALSEQLKNPTIDIFTGNPFLENKENLTVEQKALQFNEYLEKIEAGEDKTIIEAKKAKLYLDIMSIPNEEQLELSKTQAISLLKVPTEVEAMRTYLINFALSQYEITNDDVIAMIENRINKMTEDEVKASIDSMVTETAKAIYAQGVKGQLDKLPVETKAQKLDEIVMNLSNEEKAKYHDEVLEFSDSTYEENLAKLGYIDLSDPSTINIFASSFENKEIIEEAITDYNEGVDELKQIRYTDYVGLLMSSITIIIDAITYVLIAFVSVSLIVSSIMIGVITLISVQERTKEIGILRAIGASKKNVSSMFNAETLIIGFASGAVGVGVTYLLCIPINLILHALTDINTLNAVLPIPVGIILILISMLLTLIAGIIPSRSAAKKDPVVALRTE